MSSVAARENIQLNYGFNGRPVMPSNNAHVSDSSAQNTCCYDVFNNCSSETTNEPLGRECTATERNKISMSKVAWKQMVSVFLILIIGFYFVTIFDNVESFRHGYLFVCSDSEDSMVTVQGISPIFCYFKSVMILISFVFLLPFLLESFSIVTIIWVSSINDEVSIPISEGEYAGYDGVFNEVMSTNIFRRAWNSLTVIVAVPRLIVNIAKNSDAGIPMYLLYMEIVWKFVIFMMPDVILTFLLFPVAYFVMQSSQQPEDVLVNLVAVQVFATLDDVFVKTLLRPRASVGDAIQNYLSVNPKATVGKYRPMEAYLLTENRNEMGVKVASESQMREFHDYEGMHFVP